MGHAGQLIEKVQLLKRPGFFFVFLLALSSQISVALGSVASAAGILFLLFNAEARRQLRGKDTKIIFVGMTVFVLTCFLTNFFSADVVSSQKLLWTHVQRWIPFFLVVAFVRTKEEWCLVIGGMIFSMIIADVAGIYQAAHGITRPTGLERNSIYYANEILLGLFMCLGILFSKLFTKKSLSIFIVGVILLSFLAIVVSMTRGAWISLAVGLICFLFFSEHRQKRRLVISFLIAFAVLIVAILLSNSLVYDRLLSIVNLKEAANMERLCIWQGAWHMFQDYLWTGVGMGGFDRFYQTQYMLPEAREPFAIHPHNSLLNFLCENGLFGGIAFSMLFASVLYYGKINARWGIIALVQTMGFLVGSMTDHLFTVLILMRLYWFSIGLVVVAQRLGI